MGCRQANGCPMSTSRRIFLTTSGAFLAFPAAGPALAQDAMSAELAKEGPLGDVVTGKADAKVTVIEYASLTCSHCATFHEKTYPALKAKYVDTGKVKFIFREFPLDPLATAGFMLARCGDKAKFSPMIELLFQQQKNWAFVDKPVTALVNIVKQAGFTQESFDACLKRDDIYAAVNDVKNRAAEKLGVNSTPTFFINGQKHTGAFTIEELDKILAPLVGG